MASGYSYSETIAHLFGPNLQVVDPWDIGLPITFVRSRNRAAVLSSNLNVLPAVSLELPLAMLAASLVAIPTSP